MANITGTDGDNVIHGKVGADQLQGGAGNDILYAPSGDGTFEQTKVAFPSDLTINYGWNDPESTRLLADVNGDEQADIIGFGVEGVVVSLSKGDGTFDKLIGTIPDFNQENGWARKDNYFPRQVGDINGDGRADIVGFASQGVYTALGQANGTFLKSRSVLDSEFTPKSKWQNPTTITEEVNDGTIERDVISLTVFDFVEAITIGEYTGETNPRYLADVNGDKRADIVGFGGIDVDVALGKRDGTFEAPQVAIKDFDLDRGWANNYQYLRLLGDINGDGRADIVGFKGNNNVYSALGQADGTFSAVRVALSGEFLVPQGWKGPATPRTLADVNGDGWADIVGFGRSTVFVSFSKGDGTFESPKGVINDFTIDSGYTEEITRPRRVADINADGLADIVAFGTEDVFSVLAKDVGGDDKLMGDDGNDTLVGGTGSIEATGGAGADRFTLGRGVMTIKDFQRDADLSDGDQSDKIDVVGQSQDVRFRFRNGNTEIYLGDSDEPRALVEGQFVDSRDILRTSTTLGTVSAAELNDISTLVERWVDRYAKARGTQRSTVDGSGVDFKAGDVKFKNRSPVPSDNLVSAEITFRNQTPGPQTTQLTFANETNWAYTQTFTTAWKVSAKASFKTKLTAGNGFLGKAEEEWSLEVGGEYGQTNTDTNTTGGRQLNQTVTTITAAPNAVTTAEITLSGNRFNSDYTQPVTISGTVDFELLNGEKVSDMPIGAILQYYNPNQFRPDKANNIEYFTLPNGEYLSYSPNTDAIVSGTTKEAIALNASVNTTTVYDYDLSNPAANQEAKGNQNNKDRFWLALSELPAPNPPVKVTNFTVSQDQIGIIAPGIDGLGKLKLGSRVDGGITIGQVSVGDQLLAELSGIDATRLTTSNFVFSIDGSIFDDSLLPAGTPYSKILQPLLDENNTTATRVALVAANETDTTAASALVAVNAAPAVASADTTRVSDSSLSGLTLSSANNQQANKPILVTSLADVVNATDGVRTLREAIELANSQSGTDTIDFRLAKGGQINLTSQLAISDSVVINRPQSGRLTISGNSSFDLFAIGNATVTMNRLTLANGHHGISTGDNTNLTLTDINSRNHQGDGIHLGGNGSLLSVTDSRFSNNAQNGIAVDASYSTIAVSNSRFTKNGQDGLIVTTGSSNNELALSKVNLKGNGDDGIHVDGFANKITIADAKLSNNSANGFEIEYGSTNEVAFSNVKAHRNGIDGIALNGGGSNRISLSDVSLQRNTNDGLDVLSSDNQIVGEQVEFSNNGNNGIGVQNSQNKFILSNTSGDGNGYDGVFVSSLSHDNTFTVSDATFDDNGQDGFDILGNNNAISWTQVTATDNTQEGFELNADANTVTIANSQLSGNGDDGFNLDVTGENNAVTLIDTQLQDNGDDGFDIFGNRNQIAMTNVDATDNYEDGFEIDGSSNTVILQGSRLSNNEDNGFDIDFYGANNTVAVSNSEFGNNDGAGLAVVGSTNQLMLAFSSFSDNGGLAISNQGAGNELLLSNLIGTSPSNVFGV